jgi:hypothetical protein
VRKDKNFSELGIYSKKLRRKTLKEVDFLAYKLNKHNVNVKILEYCDGQHVQRGTWHGEGASLGKVVLQTCKKVIINFYYNINLMIKMKLYKK